MAKGGNKRRKVTTMTAKGVRNNPFGAVPLVKAPHSSYVGSELDFFGSFWPSCDEEDKNKIYSMRVLEVITNWQPAPGITPQLGFKVGLVTKEDPNFLSPDKEKDTHFWIIDHHQFSKEWFRHKEEEEEASKATEAEEGTNSKEGGVYDKEPAKEPKYSDIKTCGAWKIVGHYDVNGDPNRIGDIWECMLTPIPACEHGTPKQYRISRNNGRFIVYVCIH